MNDFYNKNIDNDVFLLECTPEVFTNAPDNRKL